MQRQDNVVLMVPSPLKPQTAWKGAREAKIILLVFKNELDKFHLIKD